MHRDKIRICILRAGGSNRDLDAAYCLRSLGADVDILHLNDILRRRSLATYHGLVIPGGFAYGDYVRAGAIFGKRILSSMREDIRLFVDSKKPVLGICNGFQVLVEAGVLPGMNFLSDSPEAALAANKSARFECRWVALKPNPESPCLFTSQIKQIVRFPVAHGEGRFITSSRVMNYLKEGKQIALQYAGADGQTAKGRYPQNPNGSELDIAGVCNRTGNAFGLMPHPENAFRIEQMPEWISKKSAGRGDGFPVFDSMVSYIEKTF
jgi:phosphoribosylformylglycinamidine synthase subunit PurQ / glutaminase